MFTRSLTPEFSPYLEEAPASALGAPSMMSLHERYFLYNLIRHHYQGHGVIYDGGACLGGSTVCFGRALKDKPNYGDVSESFKTPIKSFELAIFDNSFQTFFDNQGVADILQEGDSFEHILRQNIRAFEDLVELKIGDLCDVEPCAHQIEVFYSDVMKLPSIANFMVQTYFPKLLPGAILIEQDYFANETPWINVAYEYFSDHFEYIGEISSMAIFRCKKQISQEQADNFVNNYPAPDKRLELIGAAILRSIDPNRQLMLSMAKLTMVRQILGQKEALNFLKAMECETSELLTETKFNHLRLQFAFFQSTCRADELVPLYMRSNTESGLTKFDLSWAKQLKP